MSKTVLLTASIAEARAHAKAAELEPSDTVIVSSGLARSRAGAEGLKLTEDDLVVEFPGFRDGPYQRQIVEALRASIAKAGDAGPEWIAVQGKPLAP